MAMLSLVRGVVTSTRTDVAPCFRHGCASVLAGHSPNKPGDVVADSCRSSSAGPHDSLLPCPVAASGGASSYLTNVRDLANNI